MAFVSPFSKTHVERVIGGARVALATSSLFAVWMDPAEPGRHAELTYVLHGVYVVYSVVLAVLMWTTHRIGRWPLRTHVADIVVASVFQYLTLGPSSPFFVYFVFSLFSAALRWGTRGTVRTAAVVMVAFVVMGASLSRTLGPAEFELSRFIIRIAYLLVVAVLLWYLGQHEEQRREEVRQLARWPGWTGPEFDASVRRLLEHSAAVVRAQRVLVAWESDEPWLYVAEWPSTLGIARMKPGEISPVVLEALAETSFLATSGTGSDLRGDMISTPSAKTVTVGRAIHPALTERLGAASVLTAPFRTDQVSGRVLFAGIPDVGTEHLPLAEVVSREVGASLGGFSSFQRSRDIAIAEDRIRLARDLHDGVLQSLTGLRLELQSLATQSDRTPPSLWSERLKVIERALAMEQRELRSFINDLKPTDEPADTISLVERLTDLRHRLELQWRVRVALSIDLAGANLSGLMNRALPLMVHEAIVNAIRHARPSTVSVDIRVVDGTLTVAVTDDGAGFPFRGRVDHRVLEAANAGPISLRERVTSLGGRLEIESGPGGSRVDLFLPLSPLHA